MILIATEAAAMKLKERFKNNFAHIINIKYSHNKHLII